VRVLVTGGAGFVGSHIVDELVRQGHQPIVLDNLSTGRLQNIQPHLKIDAATLIEGDILDPSTVSHAVANVDVVIHLAALIDHETCLRSPREAKRVNADGTLAVLEAARQASVECFVYASSAAVYGAPSDLPLSEESPTAPISPYGSSKLAGEAHCLDYARKYGMRVACLRYFNIFGPRQTPGQYAGPIMQFMARLRESKPPIITGDGEQTRDFVSIRDVVKATLSASTSPRAQGVYNVATGKETSINQLARLMIEIAGNKDTSPIYAPARDGEIMRSVADITKARTELNFTPETDLTADLSRLWKSQIA